MNNNPSEPIDNLNIASQKVLLTPRELKQKMPLSEPAAEFIAQSRQTIANIIQGKDSRIVAVVGPCSIHDIKSAKEYALKLKALHEQLKDRLFIVMRVYFEKPRTSVGWKGLINDPHLNNSFDIEQGLTTARELLLWLAELGLPTATEMLDPIIPQYLSELISWTAIGARTSESQTHREMASGLSMPVGFKNNTSGSAGAAINAMKSASSPHRFLGINQQGQVTLLNTKGNPNGHVILRGGNEPNYHPEQVKAYQQRLTESGLSDKIIIDCSHANSGKDFRQQPRVLESLLDQIVAGNTSIIGFMLESHLNEGQQNMPEDGVTLKYGVSITDGCIDWKTTEISLTAAADQLRDMQTHGQALQNGVTF